MSKLDGLRNPAILKREFLGILRGAVRFVVHPQLAHFRMKMIIYWTIKCFNRLVRRLPHNPNGRDIFAEDWDNLIIMDACRYDEFLRCHQLSGRLERARSRGSTSSEFIKANFRDRQQMDVVYVSANGYYALHQDDIDAEICHFILADRDAADGMTTHPATLTELTLDAAEDYPNKRLIVHYMQPHSPFLGDNMLLPHPRHVWQGRIPIDNIESPVQYREAYRKNLKLVLGEVERLADVLTGKTVVTADHGELLGEGLLHLPFHFYGHTEGVYAKELIEVPWFTLDVESRKRIVEGRGCPGTEVDIDGVVSALKDLGYRT